VSLVGALTPLGKEAHNYKLWFKSVLAYTAAGMVSSIIVGAALGIIGRYMIGEAIRGPAYYITGSIGLILTAKEWNILRFNLPERKQQTEKFWAHQFGFVGASVLWGLHIGLGFFTRITYGGFWALVAIALALGDPIFGAALMSAYWLGRVLSVWVAPLLVNPERGCGELMEAILGHRNALRRISGAALILFSAIAVLLARQ
jgi:cytochrome c biogenesis protein CcdA